MSFTEPESLPGGYTFAEVVGNGINGVVVAALDPLNGERVALKRFRRGDGPVSTGLLEVANVVDIQHPYIVRCRDFGYDPEGSTYIAYDLVEGGSLRDLLNENEGEPTPFDLVLACAHQMLGALRFLHEANLIHGDVKPENILVEARNPGHFKLADLGGALRCWGGRLRVRHASGSPAYLSPERFYDTFSFNADLYSLGIVLYEMTSGDRPFSGTVTEIARSHMSRVAEMDKVRPREFVPFLEVLLEKNPKRRISSCADAERLLQIFEESGKCAFETAPLGTGAKPGGSAGTEVGTTEPLRVSGRWREGPYTRFNRFTVRGCPGHAALLSSGERPLLALGFSSHVEIWDCLAGEHVSLFLPGRGYDFIMPTEGSLYIPEGRAVSHWRLGDRSRQEVARLSEVPLRLAADSQGERLAITGERALALYRGSKDEGVFRLDKGGSTAHPVFLPNGRLVLFEGPLATMATILSADLNVISRTPLSGTVLETSPFGDALALLVDWRDRQRTTLVGFEDSVPVERPVPTDLHHPQMIPGGVLFRSGERALAGVDADGNIWPVKTEPFEGDLFGLSWDHSLFFTIYNTRNLTAVVEVRRCREELQT